MKKILRTLLMLTCVLSLTACGADETVSEMQQSKISAAETKAPLVASMAVALVTDGGVDEVLANYNNIELGKVFEATISQYDSSFTCEGKGVRSALTSFESGLEEMGAITELGDPVSTVDGDAIIVSIPAKGEKKDGSVEIIFTNDIFLTMTSCTLNLNEGVSELMTRAALNTLIGMGTVFIVLILISLIIAAFGIIPVIQAKFQKKKEIAEVPEQTVANVVEEAVVEEDELSDDMELVAVIAAAIAAYEGTSVEGFQVRSIKRANTKNWKRA